MVAEIACTFADGGVYVDFGCSDSYCSRLKSGALTDVSLASSNWKRLGNPGWWRAEVFPGSRQSGFSLFLKAFTYDNDLKDFKKAGTFYNEFLTKYPNNEFTESAKFLLENLGKSEEELKKMLEEKAKENVK